MTKTDTRNVSATVAQIRRLEKAGCEVVRVAVPDREAAGKLGEIRKRIRIPLIADIHFDFRLALEIQEDELRREIECLNGSFPLPPEKVGKFIEAFREEVRGISPERWREEMEMTLPGENSLLSDGGIRASLWENALHRCENDFQDSELELIERFIRDHRKAKNILNLRIQNKISLSTPLDKPPA